MTDALEIAQKMVIEIAENLYKRSLKRCSVGFLTKWGERAVIEMLRDNPSASLNELGTAARSFMLEQLRS